MNPDRVLTVNEYYDGPRLGVAELNGVPYIYEAEFDHSTDEYGDTYFLSPIDPELLALVLEDWAIRCRWDAAHKRGEATLASRDVDFRFTLNSGSYRRRNEPTRSGHSTKSLRSSPLRGGKSREAVAS